LKYSSQIDPSQLMRHAPISMGGRNAQRYVVDRRMPVAAGTEKRGIRAYPFPFVSNPTP
jgi:hypothetical protein